MYQQIWKNDFIKIGWSSHCELGHEIKPADPQRLCQTDWNVIGKACVWDFSHSREFGLHIRSDIKIGTAVSDFTIDEALELYLSLKGVGRQKRFFEIANRTISYLKEATSTIYITSLAPSDASAFREYLFSRGPSSSSVRRIFSCMKSIVNLAIKEQGWSCSNVFAATYTPDD